MPAPNLLFVFADQMRAQAMGCAGDAQVRTPTLDRLAAEGVYVPNTFANSPVCTPCRGTLLTGRYPLAHGAITNDIPVNPSVPSIATFTRAAGYRAGYVGKWHLDGVPRLRFTPPGPRRLGFDDFWAVCNCKHDYFKGEYFRDTDERLFIEGYEPVGQTDLALEFIDRKDDRPFCLVLSYGTPHAPCRKAPEEYLAMYPPEDIELRPNVDGEDDFIQRMRLDLGGYYAHITALDDQIARLLDGLERRGLAENTLVVFTSDHGDMLGSQGTTKKQKPWEESIGIPFLARWAGVLPAGRRARGLMSVVDFVPTVLSLMGVPVDAPMDGEDLSAMLRGETDRGAEAALLMDLVTCDQGLQTGVKEWRGLRTPTHTYARFIDGTPWVLYDNALDPWQEHDLADDPGSDALRRTLDAMLDERLAAAKDASLDWEPLIRTRGLVDLWNLRERELHGDKGRFLD